MSMSLVLQAVSDEQAALLRDGSISSNDLITPRSISYDGSGDVTHLGCGCVLTVMTLLLIVLPAWQLFGRNVALLVGAVFEVLVIAFAIQLRSLSRRKVDINTFDPTLILSDEDELCLYDWHSLHFLLTGSGWEGESPSGFLVHGGELLPAGANEGEYGPPRFIPFRQLPQIASCLEHLDLANAVSRLETANKMMTIHPGTFDETTIQSELTQLRDLISRTIEGGKSIVIQIG
jgi:Domain of unknown function (DUF1877)